MKTVALSVEKRTETGKCVNRRLRQEGKIPAILYGGDATHLLAVDKKEFEKQFKHISENILINMTIAGGDSKEVLIKDYQRDTVKGNTIHLDFFEIVRGRKLHTKVPVHLTGTPEGVRFYGGLLEQMAYEINVECLPKNLPEEISIDVSALNINQSLHIKDISFPEGVVSMDSPDGVVALVTGKASSVDEGSVDAEDGAEAAAANAE